MNLNRVYLYKMSVVLYFGDTRYSPEEDELVLKEGLELKKGVFDIEEEETAPMIR